MEGRTIARPDVSILTARRHDGRRCFNGGPDNCPARHPRGARLPTPARGFNGGPDNCPARRGVVGGCRLNGPDRFNGGPDNCPARPRTSDGVPLPELASMEGRTIARPDRGGRDPVVVAQPSFNGGPDNCPARRAVGATPRRQREPEHASMEGRTIARPDRSPWSRHMSWPWPASMEGRTIARPDPGGTGHQVVRLASMEGRTIARPDTPLRRHAPAVMLQWRAGQLPGQTDVAVVRVDSHTVRFNGGPDNCPARLGSEQSMAVRAHHHVLQWRAGQLPGQTGDPAASHHVMLQWRAGQLPGQTFRHRRQRPLQWRAGQLPGQTGRPCCDRPTRHPTASMEGRTIARPDSTADAARGIRDPRPSMEGRTIARPDRCRRRLRTAPGTLASMEGRTIARPDPFGVAVRSRRRRASMEGRTIARPDAAPGPTGARHPGFNGGPDNCPARPHSPAGRRNVLKLQWRAGQLPGQTGTVGVDALICELQWRAGQLPGQTLMTSGPDLGAGRASMEGRTIARPDPSS